MGRDKRPGTRRQRLPADPATRRARRIRGAIADPRSGDALGEDLSRGFDLGLDLPVLLDPPPLQAFRSSAPGVATAILRMTARCGFSVPHPPAASASRGSRAKFAPRRFGRPGHRVGASNRLCAPPLGRSGADGRASVNGDCAGWLLPGSQRSTNIRFRPYCSPCCSVMAFF
jgi:hypothetical protein